MKKILLPCCLLLSLPLAAQAAPETKIDPATYICAELITQPITTAGEPPIFTGLQLDGFVGASLNMPVADPATMPAVLGEVFAACQAKPTEKAAVLWKEVRKNLPAPADGPWKADKTTCKDYGDNPDDGSGFVIWLDGYHRGKSGKPASVLESNESLTAYLEACSQKPEALMLDVMAESVK